LLAILEWSCAAETVLDPTALWRADCLPDVHAPLIASADIDARQWARSLVCARREKPLHFDFQETHSGLLAHP
jgi:hypothetical protein